MATYKEIKGDTIEVVTSDPTNPGEGDIWYNSTTGVIKGYQLVASAWSSGGSLNTGGWGLAGAGTQNAALAFGRFNPGVFTFPGNGAVTEEYNGLSWSEQNDMATARRQLALGTMGTQTAALGAGGYAPTQTNATEEYDGSNWTSGGNLGLARAALGAAGTQTAGLVFGGSTPPFGFTTHNETEEYNGTTWSEQNNLSTARSELCGMGTQTAALTGGGQPGGPPTSDIATTEEYNGTSWTAGGTMNTARSKMGSAGTQTTGLIFGGTPLRNITEEYDGSIWTNSAGTLSTGRQLLAGAGSQSAGLAFGGSSPYLASTEEYTRQFIGTKNFTTS